MTTFDEDFKALVTNGDLTYIKAVVIRFIDNDIYLSDFQFRQAAAYAHKQLSMQSGEGLIEKDDGKWSLPPDKQDWNEALWQTLKVKLMRNFSQEKLDAMESLMRHLRTTGVPRFQVEDNAFSQCRTEESAPRTSTKGGDGLLPICIAGGTVAGLVIGVVVRAKLAGVLLGCAAGVGVYYYLKRRANKS